MFGLRLQYHPHSDGLKIRTKGCVSDQLSKKNFQIPENRTLREECERVLVSEWLFDFDFSPDSRKTKSLTLFHTNLYKCKLIVPYLSILQKRAGHVIAIQPHFCLRKNLRYKITISSLICLINIKDKYTHQHLATKLWKRYIGALLDIWKLHNYVPEIKMNP